MREADLHWKQHRWFSGRMLACHAGGPGSIPGRCSCKTSFVPLVPISLRIETEQKMFEVAPPGGLEPPTFWLTAERASQLRHGGLKVGAGSPELVRCSEAVDVKREKQEQV